ncbi:enamine deaminase RidA (YjgF/YER057c/UK114 family) [Siphonobacter sp. SORGH_AS 1065]|nr:enamine deaminase RidA (YjgF/YER057c/UK114 family) [Siphonobacter sp. SORGH_AS_1065]
MKKQIIFTPNAPAPIGPYSQAIKIDGRVYVSGQIAADLASSGAGGSRRSSSGYD